MLHCIDITVGIVFLEFLTALGVLHFGVNAPPTLQVHRATALVGGGDTFSYMSAFSFTNQAK
jgi:hypothetical protein